VTIASQEERQAAREAARQEREAAREAAREERVFELLGRETRSADLRFLEFYNLINQIVGW
jgi:hypothetical protein